MTTMLENRMVIGEYFQDTAPSIAHTCPRCHAKWAYLEADDCWDAGTSSVSGTEAPYNGHVCRICAWDLRTPEQELAYIKDMGLEIESLVYGMTLGRSWTDDEMWLGCYSALLAEDPALLQSAVDSYISARRQEEFIEYVLETVGEERNDNATL